MSWLRFRGTAPPVTTEEPAAGAALDHLLSQYVVEVSDATVEEICRSLAALPSNLTGPAARARAAPLFWPGLGVAFGMLLLGIVIGTAGLPVPLTATDSQPEFSDLLMAHGA